MNKKQIKDALKEIGIETKEAGALAETLLRPSGLSKDFTPFDYLACLPNRASPEMQISRTESPSGKVHVLGFVKYEIKSAYYKETKRKSLPSPVREGSVWDIRRKLKAKIQSNTEVNAPLTPLMLLTLFVSMDVPPEQFKYTGTEKIWVIDLSFPNNGFLPVEITDGRVCLASSLHEALKNRGKGAYFSNTPVQSSHGLWYSLQFYSSRLATPEERKDIFKLYDVAAKPAAEFDPRKTAKNPKGAGAKPQYDQESDKRIFKRWNKWREQPGNGRRGQTAFLEETGLDMTKKALGKLINRTRKK